MSYDAYLLVMSQLSSQKRARVVIQGSVIFIETTPKSNKWRVSTQVFSCDGCLPQEVRQCVSSAGVLRFQERGAFLRLDPETNAVFLVHEIDTSRKYVPFKYLMSDFVDVANEWKEILDEFSSRDHFSLRLNRS